MTNTTVTLCFSTLSLNLGLRQLLETVPLHLILKKSVDSCLLILSISSASLYSRPSGVERRHYRVSAVSLLLATAVVCGSGLLLLPDEAAPPV